MASPSNPTEIAREAFRQLATRKIPPTPENYRTYYHQVAGTGSGGAEPFPEKLLRALLLELPRETPAQSRLARQIELSIDKQSGDAWKQAIANFARSQGGEPPAWGELIEALLRQWDARQAGLTPAKKRESLEHILASAGSNPETLHGRLQGLVRAWSQTASSDDDGQPLADPVAPAAEDGASLRQPVSAPSGTAAALLPELRELFAFTLETAIATQLVESPELSTESRRLAARIRDAGSLKALDGLLADIKRFAFRLELLADDRSELRAGLLHLLQLVIENISELVVEDRWLHGQVEVVRDIIQQPLSLRSIDDAERRLKEVIFKQSQLKHSLNEAKEALKSMLAGFVDHLAEFAGHTTDYHDKIEVCAQKITQADDIGQLEQVLQEVMQETRRIQLNALRSRDELQAARLRVDEAEQRIARLQAELDQASTLVRHDQLTGALNRRGLEETFDKETARARRRKSPLCVALLDIDNFKKLNDSLGHDAGDAALIHLARVIKETMRPQDTVARYGGEEFVILLPDTDLDAANQALTRLQRELTRRFFLHNNDKLLITFSAGVTEYTEADTQATVTKRADEAMYQAKQSGKNRVVVA